MTQPMLGIIPAAGSGIRARPYTYEQHKGMFLIDGKPNIGRLLDLSLIHISEPTRPY